jgi:alpha-glucosidase
MHLFKCVLGGLAAIVIIGCSAGEDQATEPATPAAAVQAQPKEPASVQTHEVQSPDQRLTLTVTDEGGQLHYSISQGADEVIRPSMLGMRFADHHGFDDNLEIIDASTSSVDTSWEQPWGERSVVRDQHNELLVQAQDRVTNQRIDVRFRLFNDGVGFRYEVPGQTGLQGLLEITEELTEFSVPEQSTSWWIPSREWNRYEYIYHTTDATDVYRAHTPITFRSPSGAHLSIHEAALVDYSGMSLLRERGETFRADLAPWSDGVLVKTQAPFKTPWRTIQIAEDAPGLVNSDLILNLNEPNKLGDVSWVEPGKYVGIWWAMHIRDRTWGNDGVHGATTEETKRYMDFAAKYGFDGVLVEGWNFGWDGDWFHNGDVFSFTESYPDFDIEAVSAHGEEIGVRLIGHHETSGSVTNYENQLSDAFDLYEQMGVRQVKTGYVADAGDIKRIDENGITKYEWHDGQFMVDHHLRVVKEAAKRKISINPHEPVKDTGLRRTYPNWITREGARGQEFNAWGIPPNPPEHTAILPYTRMLSGPMDFTPGIFDLRPSERPPITEEMGRNDPRSRIETTLAKQLALYVVLYSPIQMAADLPENYEARPDAFQFIRDVPADWENSIALAGEIGDFIAIARQERGGEDWYVGALTDENARSLDLTLDFLEDGASYTAQIYRDGPQADYDQNPYDIIIEEQTVARNDVMTLQLARSGGAAIRLQKN